MAKSLRLHRSRPATPAGSPHVPLLIAALLTFATAASAGIWGLQLLAGLDPVPHGAMQAGRLDAITLAEAAPMLFGGPEAVASQPVAAVSRFTLLGVIGGGDKAGAALIGVTGKAPRAVAVGAQVEPGVTLLDTGFDQALLRERDSRVELRMPRRTPYVAPAAPQAAGMSGLPSGPGVADARPPGLPEGLR